jgi:hypothetical protein
LTSSVAFWFVVFAGACNSEAPDADGDGVDASLDCDDGDPSVNPYATERCNGIDDNCDGAVDEGVLHDYHPDADGDGYGTAAVISVCVGTPNTSPDGSDCDDSNPDVHPTALEICANGIDEDCDGEDPATEIWYADADGDGYGDPTTSVEDCDAPTAFIADSSDCDDGDAAVHPGVAERCDNAIDDDCDGVVASNADTDADGWYADACVGGSDCDDGDETIHPDAIEECDEIDSDCDGRDCCAVAAWPLDGDAIDASGNGNDGTVKGSVPTSDRNGNVDAAFYFDGTTYIDIPPSKSLDAIETGSEVTIAGWIRVDAWFDSVFPIIEKYSESGDDGWEMILIKGSFLLVTPGTNASVPFTPSLGQWYFVAISYDQAAGEAWFYSDGVALGSAPYARPIGPTDEGDLHIGWSAIGPDEYSTGAIDDLYLFDCALTDEEIADLYTKM